MNTQSNDKQLNIGVVLQRAVQAHQQGDLGTAEGLCKGILKQYPLHFMTLHLLGIIAYQVGDDKFACKCLVKALKQQPDHIEALTNIAVIHMNLGDTDKAEKAYLKVLAIDNKNIAALANYGNFFKNTGDLEKATQYYNKVIELDADHVATISNMASIANSLQQYQKAEELSKKALAIENTHENAQFNLGLSYQKQAKIKQALDQYRQLLTINAHHIEALNNMAIIFMHTGRLEDAIQLLEVAYKRNPVNLDTLTNLSAVYSIDKQIDKAMQYNSKALKHYPDNELLASNMAKMHIIKGDFHNAGKLFKKLHQQNKLLLVDTYLAEISLALYQHRYTDVIKLVDSAQSNKEINKFIITDLLVSKSIAAWLNFDVQLLADVLAENQQNIDAINSEYKSVQDIPYVNFGNIQVNHSRFTELLSCHKTNDGLYCATQQNDAKFYMLADGHCMAFNHLVLKKHPQQTIQLRLVSGTKIWHLVKPRNNMFKAGFKAALDSVNTASSIIFGFGEIDCRPDDGIFVYAKKSGKKVNVVIKELLDSYIDMIVSESQKRQFNVIIYGVSALSYNLSILDADEKAEFIELITFFNKYLGELASKHDLGFIDIYRQTCDMDKQGSGNMNLDTSDVHPLLFSEMVNAVL